MLKLATSEYNLLRLTQALFDSGEKHYLAGLLHKPHIRVKAFSHQAMAALTDSLSKGSIIKLARLGWGCGEVFVQGQVIEGRWWQQEVQPMTFSSQSIALLNWLLESPLSYHGKFKPFVETTQGLGDELLMMLAATIMAEQDCQKALHSSPAMRESALVGLCLADKIYLDDALTENELENMNLLELFAAQNSWLLQALQPCLVQSWLRMELAKQNIHSVDKMMNLGQSQKRILHKLYSLAEQYNRNDLLAFVYAVAGKIMAVRPSANNWLKSLPEGVSLKQQSQWTQASMCLFQCIEDHFSVISTAQRTRFFDDDYDYQQLILRNWQTYGEDNRQWALVIRDQLQNFRENNE